MKYSSSLWRTLTREQQKLWIDLREAARVRGTKSGTPPFKLQTGQEGQYSGANRQDAKPPKSNRRANHTLTEEESDEEPEEEEITPSAPEDSEQAAFEEDNLSEDQKR